MARGDKEIINPATRFFEWKGGAGQVEYYDREAKERISVPLPFTFLVLDKVAQVAGGVNRGGEYIGFWSNAVRDTRTQPFIVKSSYGVEVEGLWAAIKGHNGVKFAQGLYIAYKNDDGELVIGYLKLTGAAFSSWLDFTRQHRSVYHGAYSIVSKRQETNGATTYFVPEFNWKAAVAEETENAALALTQDVKEYLTAYFESQGMRALETHAAVTHDDPLFSGPDVTQDPPPETGAPDYYAAEADDDGDIPF